MDLEADPHFDNNIEEEESDDEESDEESTKIMTKEMMKGETTSMSTKGEINPSMRNSKLCLDENHETQSVNFTDVIKRNVFSRADILRENDEERRNSRAFRHLPGARKRSFGAGQAADGKTLLGKRLIMRRVSRECDYCL